MKKDFVAKEIMLISFNIMISLVILVVPILLNQIMEGKIQFTDSIICLIVGTMCLEMLLQSIFLIVQQRAIKKYKMDASLKLYQEIFEMKYESLGKNGATYLIERADTTVLTYANFFMRAIPTIIAKSIILILVLIYSYTINICISFILISIILSNIVGFSILNKQLPESVKLTD